MLPLGLGYIEGITHDYKRKAIRRGSFSSVKDLVGEVDHFVTQYNKDCRPFVWTVTADSILGKLERLSSRISGTGH
jgi:putative transposase